MGRPRLAPGTPIRPVRIAGTGAFLPPKVVTNFDLEKTLDTNDAWIQQRTGIRERRVVSDGLTNSEMSTRAARQALDAAGLTPADLDLILVATISGDYTFPSTACLVQSKLGATHAGAADLGAACTGFIYALSSAWGQIAAGIVDNVLVVGCEVMSSVVDWTDRNSCILFGDGAGAVVVRPATPESGRLYDVRLCADGSDPSLLYVPAGGSVHRGSVASIERKDHLLKMKGREVFRFAVEKFRLLIDEALERGGFGVDEVALVIPHQVNARVVEAALRHLDIPPERVFINIDRTGNTSAASVPIAIHEAVSTGRLKPGDLAVLIAFGAGLTWGSATLRL